MMCDLARAWQGTSDGEEVEGKCGAGVEMAINDLDLTLSTIHWVGQVESGWVAVW